MIDIGDFGPDLALTDQHGKPYALYSHDIAGASNAMFFVEEASPAALEDAVALIRDRFKAPSSRAIAITPLAANSIGPIADSVEFPVWSDPEGEMMTAIAGGRPRTSSHG